MKSPFQEQLKKDVSNVFMNVNELGKVVDFNGAPLTVVEDVAYHNEVQLTHGVDKEHLKLICSESDFPTLPKVYELVTIDNKEWYITSIANPTGFLIITLEAYKL